MKKALFGIISVFMAISLAWGSCFLIEKNIPETSQSAPEEEQEIEVQASGYWVDYYASKFAAGNGSYSDPYQIATAAQLARLAFMLNFSSSYASYADKYYKLTADIDLSAHYWTPIGRGDVNVGRQFSGNFIGNGYTISGITIDVHRGELGSSFGFFDASLSYNFKWWHVLLGSFAIFAGLELDKCCGVGLFGVVNGAKLRDFNVDGSYRFSGDTDDFWGTEREDCIAQTFIGGAVGYAMGYTTIENVNNIGLDITCIRTKKGIFEKFVTVGGVVGLVSELSDVLNCVNYDGKIEFSVSQDGDAIEEMKHILGGVIGVACADRIHGCYNYAKISFSNPDAINFLAITDQMTNLNIGGIVGYACLIGEDTTYELDIKYCYNFGKIETTGIFVFNNMASFGGIVGGSDLEVLEISNCSNYGSITLSNIRESFVGGIIGMASNTQLTLSNCSNFGDMNLTEEKKANESSGFGGIVGYIGEIKTSLITDCVNYGVISFSVTKNIANIGGILGRGLNNIDIVRCVNYGNISTSKSKNVGGIVGSMGSSAEYFLWFETQAEKNSNALANCINYAKVTADSKYGQLVGNMYGNKLVKCYYVNSGNAVGYDNVSSSNKSIDRRAKLYIESMNFFSTYSNWSSDKLNGVTAASFNITSSYNSSFNWLITPLVVDYYDSLSKSRDLPSYTIVPMGSVASGYVKLSWDREDDEFETTDVSEIFVFQRKTYSTGVSNYWEEVTLTDSQAQIWFLRGVSYYTNLVDNLYKITISDYYREKTSSERPVGFVFDKYELTASTPSILDMCLQDNIGSTYNAEFRVVPLQQNYFRPFSSYFTLDARFTSKNINSLYVQSYYEKGSIYAGLSTDISIGNLKTVAGTVDILHDGKSVSSSNKVYYNDVMQVNVTPELGYTFIRLEDSYREDKTGTKQIFLNEEVGKFQNQYNYNFQNNLKVYYKGITYSYDLVLDHETYGITTDDNTAVLSDKYLMRDCNEGNKTLKSNNFVIEKNARTKEVLHYGYEYQAYLCDYGETQYENGVMIGSTKTVDRYNVEDEDLTLTYSADEMIEAMKSLWDNQAIEKESFRIILKRIPIEYTVNVHNMANKYNSYEIWEEINESNAGNFIAGNDFVLGENGFAGFNTQTQEYTTTIKLNAGYDEKNKLGLKMSSNTIAGYSALNRVSFEKYSSPPAFSILQKNQMTTDIFLDIIESFVASRNTETQKRSTTIDLYAYFELQKYEFVGSIVCDGITSNNGAFANITMTTNESRYINANADTKNYGSDEIYYYAQTTLTVNNIAQGYSFVGWYLTTGTENKLLSLDKSYAFAEERISYSSSKQLKITAKFVQYRLTTNHDVTDTKKVYEISSAEDLMWLSEQHENGISFEGCTFNQIADIDMSGIEFNPIGTTENPFKAVYNGNNHTISNLTLTSWQLSNRGLFGCVENATIKNLTVVDGSITGYSNVGTIVGYAKNSTFEYINNKDSNIVLQTSSFYNIYGEEIEKNISNERIAFGGLVGYAENSTFFACSTRANIEGVNHVGGIVGLLQEGSLEQCFFKGNVSDLDVCGELATVRIDSAENVEDLMKNCYYVAFDGTTYLVNADTIDSSAYSGKYNANEVTLDSKIWIVVNDTLTLRAFYWN